MDIILYHFQGCPYCARVRDFMSQQGIVIAMKDTHANAGYQDELVTIGGKSQVPCLVINGKALYESLDILDWLQKNRSLITSK